MTTQPWHTLFSIFIQSVFPCLVLTVAFWSTYRFLRRQLNGDFQTKHWIGVSLVAQWQRICLPIQKRWVQSLIQEDPTCCGATIPVCHDYWTCALEPGSHNSWALVPQLLKPRCPIAHVLQQEQPLQWEICVPQLESSPHSHNYRKTSAATKTQHSQK